jgi:hypothetical protein
MPIGRAGEPWRRPPARPRTYSAGALTAQVHRVASHAATVRGSLPSAYPSRSGSGRVHPVQPVPPDAREPYLAAFSAGAVLTALSPEAKTAFEPLGEALAELGKFAALLVFGALLTPHLFGDLPFGGYVVPAAVAPPAGPQQLCRCPGGRHLDRTGQARRPAASDESRPGLDRRGFRLVGSAAGGRPVCRCRTPEPLTLPFVAVLIFRSADAAPGARPRCAASRRVGSPGPALGAKA